MTAMKPEDARARLRDWLLGLAMALALALASPAEAGPPLNGRVVKVVDGDTIDVLDDAFRTHRIRFAWTDAPESGQAFGRAAKKALAEIVFGKRVTIEVVKFDRYGSPHGKRLIGSVFLGQEDVGLTLVGQGWAWHNEPFMREQPAESRRAYAKAQAIAREARLGLWRDASQVAPWRWRREARAPPVQLHAPIE